MISTPQNVLGDACRCLKIHVSSCLFSGTLIWRTSALVSFLLALHCVFNARHLLGSSWMSLSGIQPGNSPKGLSWDNYRVYHIDFLFFKDHCPLLPEIQYLVNCGFTYLVCILFISSAPCLLHVELTQINGFHWDIVIYTCNMFWSYLPYYPLLSSTSSPLSPSASLIGPFLLLCHFFN